jgi:hypothetical protein
MTAIQPNALATGQIKVTESHHLIGFIVNNPERMPCLLHRHREVPWLEPADDIEQLGVGRYEQNLESLAHRDWDFRRVSQFRTSRVQSSGVR